MYNGENSKGNGISIVGRCQRKVFVKHETVLGNVEQKGSKSYVTTSFICIRRFFPRVSTYCGGSARATGGRDNFNALYINLITLVFGAQGYVLLSSNDINFNFGLRAALIAGLSVIGSLLALTLQRTLNKIDALNKFRYRKLAKWEAQLNLPAEFRYYTEENTLYSEKPDPDADPDILKKLTSARGILDDLPTVMSIIFVSVLILVGVAVFIHYGLHEAIIIP